MDWHDMRSYGIYFMLGLFAVSVLLNLAGKKADTRQMVEKFENMADTLTTITDKLDKTVNKLVTVAEKPKDETSDSEDDRVERFRDMKRYKHDYKLL
jgi:hypothetical protein